MELETNFFLIRLQIIIKNSYITITIQICKTALVSIGHHSVPAPLAPLSPPDLPPDLYDVSYIWLSLIGCILVFIFSLFFTALVSSQVNENVLIPKSKM